MRRRRSLLGPILILGLGLLFLLRNFRPDIPVWDLVGKYWPVLLILWGLAKLAEALSPPQPGVPPRPTLTVGEFFLALFVILIGVAASRHGAVIDIDPFAGIFGETYTYTQELTQPVPERKPDIVIINPGGEIRVTGADRFEIQVKAEKRVRAQNENDAKALQAQAPVEITQEGSQYFVRSNADRTYHGAGLRVSLDVHVPRNATLDLQGRRGDVQVSEVAGPVSVNVERGDVTLTDIGDKVKLAVRRGSLSAQRIKGSVELDGRGSDIQVSDVEGDVIVRGDYTGSIAFANVKQVVKVTTSRTDLEVQKLPGKVDMTIGALTISEPGGAVTVTTRAKDIRIEEFQGPVQIVNRDATVELSTSKLPLRNIEVDNRSGRIDLALPANSEFQIEATARRGEVNSDFPLSVQRDHDSGAIRGSVGKSGASIKLTTTFGTIYLRKQG